MSISFNLPTGVNIKWGDPITTFSFNKPVYENKKHLNVQIKEVGLGALLCLAALYTSSTVLTLAMLGAGAYIIYNGSSWSSAEGAADLKREVHNLWTNLWTNLRAQF